MATLWSHDASLRFGTPHPPDSRMPSRKARILIALAALAYACCDTSTAPSPTDPGAADAVADADVHDVASDAPSGDVEHDATDAGHAPDASVEGDASGASDASDVADAGPTSPLPQALSDTGWFDDVRALTPGPTLVPFDVAVPFFSDHASKQRFITLPADTAVDVDADGVLIFPVGAAVVKTMSDPRMSSPPWLEVRAWILTDEGWRPGTWVWDAALADGVRIDDGVTLSRPHPTDAAAGDAGWVVPAMGECIRCHGDADPQPLAFVPRQLDRPDDPGAASLVEAGALATTLAPSLALVDPHGAAPLEARARSWMDVNCGSCHARGVAGARRGLILTIDATTESELGICRYETLGSPTPDDVFWILAPGDPDASALWYRAASAAPGARMPDVRYVTVDDDGVALLYDWIAAMQDTSCDER